MDSRAALAIGGVRAAQSAGAPDASVASANVVMLGFLSFELFGLLR